MSPATKARSLPKRSYLDELVKVLPVWQASNQNAAGLARLTTAPSTTFDLWAARLDAIASVKTRRGGARIAANFSLSRLRDACRAENETGRVLQDLIASWDNAEPSMQAAIRAWGEVGLAASAASVTGLRFTDLDILGKFIADSQSFYPTLGWTLKLERRPDNAHELNQYRWPRALKGRADFEVTMTDAGPGETKSLGGTMVATAHVLANDETKVVLEMPVLHGLIAYALIVMDS